MLQSGPLTFEFVLNAKKFTFPTIMCNLNTFANDLVRLGWYCLYSFLDSKQPLGVTGESAVFTVKFFRRKPE